MKLSRILILVCLLPLFFGNALAFVIDPNTLSSVYDIPDGIPAGTSYGKIYSSTKSHYANFLIRNPAQAEGGAFCRMEDLTSLAGTGSSLWREMYNVWAVETVAHNKYDLTIEQSIGGSSASISGTIEDIHNIGTIGPLTSNGVVGTTITGANAKVTGATGQADVDISRVYGLYSHAATIQNNGTINMTVAGGTAQAAPGSDATASIQNIYGIRAQTNVTNTGSVTLTATSGHAQAAAGGDNSAKANATSILAIESALGNVSNSGDVTLNITGGDNIIAGSSLVPDNFDGYTKYSKGMYANGRIINTGNVIINITRGQYQGTHAGTDVDLSISGIVGIHALNGPIEHHDGVVKVTVQERHGVTPNGDDLTIDQIYGLKSNNANVTSSGIVRVNINGGDNALANIDQITGIHSHHTLTHTGDLTVNVNGGAGADVTQVRGLHAQILSDSAATIAPSSGNISVSVISNGNAANIYGIDGLRLTRVGGRVSASAVSNGNGMVSVWGINTSDHVTGDAEITVVGEAQGSGATDTATATGIATLNAVDYNGDINVSSSSRCTGSTLTAARGISTPNAVTSNGRITINAHSSATGQAVVEAIGVATDGAGSPTDRSVVNGGEMRISVTSADSVTNNNLTGTAIRSGGSATNQGNITTHVNSGSGLVSAINAIAVQSTTDGINNGTITVDAYAGSATTVQSLVASGIRTTAGDITNNQRIQVTANSGDTTTGNFRLFGVDAANGDVNNPGTITVSGSSKSSTGGSAPGDLYGVVGIHNQANVTNSGNIDVTAASSLTTTPASGAYVHGVMSTGSANHSGNIRVAASTTTSADVLTVSGIHSNTSVTNTGTFDVSYATQAANLNDFDAYSIHLGSGSAKTLSSLVEIKRPVITGVGGITKQGYAVGFTGGNTGTIANYAMRMVPSPSTPSTLQGEGEIYVDQATTLQVANGAVLHLEPGQYADGFRYNTYYDMPRIVTKQTGAATTELQPLYITEAEVTHGEMKPVAEYASDSNGTYIKRLSLQYDPPSTVQKSIIRSQLAGAQKMADSITTQVASSLVPSLHLVQSFGPETPVLKLATQLSSLINKRNRYSDTMVAALPDPTPRDSENTFSYFLYPYTNKISDTNSTMGFEGTASGLTLGMNATPAEGIILGAHVRYTQYDVETQSSYAMYDSRKDDQTIYSVGLHGLYSLTENWYLRGVSSLHFVSHDYTAKGGMDGNTPEKASFNSHNLLTNVLLGYQTEWDNNTLLPEVGLQHYYLSQEGFTATAQDAGIMNTTYGAVEDHIFYCLARIRWIREFEFKKADLFSTLGAGLQQQLSNANVVTVQSVPGAPATPLEVDPPNRLYQLSGSLIYSRGVWALGLGYDGGFAKDLTSHTFWGKLQYAF